jgi:hypothetical protein
VPLEISASAKSAFMAFNETNLDELFFTEIFNFEPRTGFDVKIFYCHSHHLVSQFVVRTLTECQSWGTPFELQVPEFLLQVIRQC